MWFPCKIFFLLLLTHTQGWTFSPADSIFHINQLPVEGLLLDKGWKYQAGDNLEWASPQWNDRDWQPINPTLDIHALPGLWSNKIGWFRLHFSVDSVLNQESLALLVAQTGATQIYLNGELIGKYGQLDDKTSKVKAVSPAYGEFISLHPNSQPIQVLAVRFALQKQIPYVNFIARYNWALVLRVMDMKAVTMLTQRQGVNPDYIKASIFFILALIHFVLFYYSPARKANLYFFIFALLFMLNWGPGTFLYNSIEITSLRNNLLIVIVVLAFTGYFFFLLATYAIFKQPKGLIFRGLTAIYILSIPVFLWNYEYGWMLGTILFPLLNFTETARITLLEDRKKIPGVRIVSYGALSFLVIYPLANAFIFGLLPDFSNGLLGNITFNVGVLSLPVSLSIYLATEASFTSRSLQAKLVEVQQLSEKMIIQEREKRQLQEMDELKSRFFANISHEFRTPLSLIRGTVEKLRKKDAAADRQADYRAIDRSAGRLLQMINQLLDLSRLESNKLSLHRQPGNLSEVLRVLGGSFSSLFESKGIIYRYTAPLQPVWVQLDREKLEAIINNLLSNAAKFTPAGGQVSFTATLQMADSYTCTLQILVEDTGIGIPQAQLPHIFERFYQVDSSVTRHYEGTGIGLALVKELVALHRGKVEVQSREGQGSTFTLHILYTLADAAQVEREHKAEIHRENQQFTKENNLTEAKEERIQKGEFTGKKPKQTHQILVVEDNADLRGFIAGYLSESYGVKQAADGVEGYHIAVETVPDLIISDIMMPGLDGVSLCRKLKSDERTSHIPLILLTAKADAGSKISGLQTGADDYLTKPFSAEELLLRVNNLIQGRQKLKEKYSRSLSLEPAGVHVASADERFLKKTLAIMEQNMGNADFDVDSFSREVGMSRAQLNRKLTALLDQSPNEFIRTMRLKRAAQLLRQKQSNVGEVAFLVGFSNPNYFTKCFRDHYGVAPSEYANHDTSD